MNLIVFIHSFGDNWGKNKQNLGEYEPACQKCATCIIFGVSQTHRYFPPPENLKNKYGLF